MIKTLSVVVSPRKKILETKKKDFKKIYKILNKFKCFKIRSCKHL